MELSIILGSSLRLWATVLDILGVQLLAVISHGVQVVEHDPGSWLELARAKRIRDLSLKSGYLDPESM